jgi:hypothetical protein
MKDRGVKPFDLIVMIQIIENFWGFQDLARYLGAHNC